MIGARTRPLLIALGIGAAALTVRLFEVQVREHEIWAEEAASLVHSGREIPYRRGRILDTEGRVLARDKDTHTLVLVYRDFRRGHPLGLVAHARSLLEARPVPLLEARRQLLEWTWELVHLSPVDLDAFARGGPLATDSLALEETEAPRAESRGQRARDLGFYVRHLLPLEPRQRQALEKRARDEKRPLSFLSLAAEEADVSEGQAWSLIEERLARAMDRLAQLADLLAASPDGSDEAAGDDAQLLLIDELERSRHWVEDATAAKLFAEAADFVPGRLDPITLRSRFDLDWIARLLGWDARRLEEWTRETREGWRRGWRDGYALPRLLVQLTLDPAHRPSPDDLVARLTALFRREGAVEAILDGDVADWRQPVELAVLGQLDPLLAADLPIASEAVPVSVLSPGLASLEPTPGGWDGFERSSPEVTRLWRAFDAAWNVEPAEAYRGERVRDLLASRRWDALENLLVCASALADDWDRAFQRAVEQRLAAFHADSRESERAPDGRLTIAEGPRDRAAERAEFFLKDYGRRPRRLARGEPSYDVIYLLTRYHEDYPGFEVQEAREREYPVLPGDAVRAAPGLIGNVSAIGVDDMLVQRQASSRLRELKELPEKSEEERVELERLIGRVLLHDEVKGVAGVEGFWNRELVGRNGYREAHGLEDVFGTGRRDTELSRGEDGRDVVLTLDTDLQRAARLTLEAPVNGDDPKADVEWIRNPVGAAVLVSIEGDVLAAASEPNGDSVRSSDVRGQRAIVSERTLRRPTFQPPGSVFKPFVAAYALSEVGLDPRTPVVCEDIGEGAGYVDVHCHRYFGHGEVALAGALVGSCNAYFAWLGETLTDDDLRAVSRIFGFDQPTGIRTAPPWDHGLRARGGFREDVGGMRAIELGRFGDHDRRLAGNGLGVMEATPLALARAMIALATGELTDLRLVRRVANEELPLGRRRPLPLDRRALDFVRESLIGVTSDPEGTGNALALSKLGFPVAAKTGSADLVRSTDSSGRSVVRKHAWVAGWVPARDPQLVFVVFVHDTMATSSHGAVYLVRDMLLRPEVLNWLAERGVDVSQVPAR